MWPPEQDATFEMERKRNRPEKYDRQLVHKTVKSMQKVEEVRALPPPLSSSPPLHSGIQRKSSCVRSNVNLLSCMQRLSRHRLSWDSQRTVSEVQLRNGTHREHVFVWGGNRIPVHDQFCARALPVQGIVGIHPYSLEPVSDFANDK